MSTYDLVLAKRTVSPAVLVNGTVNGVAVDRAVNGGMQDAVVIVSTGTITDGSHAVAVQDSADGSTDWTAVAAAQLTGAAPTIVAANDDTVFEVGVRSTRRYVRATVTTTSATSGGAIGVLVALGQPRFAPASH